jgi:hypothetical protein
VGHPRLSPRRAHARDAGQTARGSRTHLSQLDAIDDERGVLSVLLGGILELLDRDRGQRAVTEIPLPAIAPAPGGAIPEPTARLRALESATERLRARVVAALLLAATKAATATAAAKATAVLLLLSTSNNAVRATLPRLDRWTPRASERAASPSLRNAACWRAFARRVLQRVPGRRRRSPRRRRSHRHRRSRRRRRRSRRRRQSRPRSSWLVASCVCTTSERASGGHSGIAFRAA